jgi:ABC-type uncharacterized transport system substrate-binding protein
VQAAARGMGVRIQSVSASTSSEIETAFACLLRDRPDALFVGSDSFFNSQRAQIAALAAGAAIPASFSVRDYVEVGGLISTASVSRKWTEM